jgi:VanZ family protein
MSTLFVIGARSLAWIMALVIFILSVVPSWLRPETGAPNNFEHFTAFFFTGIAFGLSYGRKPFSISAALLLFAAMIEVVQIFVPGRHARFSDFFVDGIAVVTAGMVAALIGRTFSAKASGIKGM